MKLWIVYHEMSGCSYLAKGIDENDAAQKVKDLISKDFDYDYDYYIQNMQRTLVEIRKLNPNYESFPDVTREQYAEEYYLVEVNEFKMEQEVVLLEDFLGQWL